MCTFLNLKQSSFNLVSFGFDLAEDGNLKEALKNQLTNCGTFTTPFGLEPDPTNPALMRLRSFPITASFDVRADCAEALVRGETVNIKKKPRPICTNLLLGANGASLGVGLGIEASAGSRLIKAEWTSAEDADPAADDSGNEVRYRHSADEGEEQLTIGPVRGTHHARRFHLLPQRLPDPPQGQLAVRWNPDTHPGYRLVHAVQLHL
jgi:hypothetical protein